MMNRIVLIAVLLLGLTPELYAQGERNGTNGAPELMIGVDAQFLNGGGATADAVGLSGALWNPAGLDRAAGNVHVMVSHREYIADIGAQFLGIGLRAGNLGTVAVHLRNFAIGEIPVTTEFNQDGTGETFTPVFFTLGTTLSRSMTDRISVGATANLVYESFSNVSASGVALDAGVQYANFLGVDGLRLGVAIRNIGTSMQFDGSGLLQQAEAQGAERPVTQYKIEAATADMPTTIDLGASFVPVRNLTVAATYSENAYSPSQIRGRAQYDFMNTLMVRGSYTLTTETTGVLKNIWDGPSVGATLNLQRVIGQNIAIDYAAVIPTDYFAPTHTFAIRGSF